MKLHYMGKYDLKAENLPHGEHKEGAVRFKEAESSKKLSVIANAISIVIMLILGAVGFLRAKDYISDSYLQLMVGILLSFAVLFPHELLHAICFKKDVYLYTNWAQGMLFVVGPEDMSKARFIFMSLLPNIVFGIIPYIIAMIFPQYVFLLSLGILATGMGAGDYYNVFNALTQMPKGARTYLYQFNSYWYMP